MTLVFYTGCTERVSDVQSDKRTGIGEIDSSDLAFSSDTIFPAETDLQKFLLKGPVVSMTAYSYPLYPDNGNYIHASVFGSGAELEFTEIWTFNASGNISEYQILDEEKKLVEKSFYLYNNSGQLSRINLFSPQGDLLNQFHYTYRQGRNEIIQSKIPVDGIYNELQFVYDDSGRCIEEHYFLNAKSAGTVVKKYNDTMNAKIELYFDADGNFVSTTSTYFNRQDFPESEIMEFNTWLNDRQGLSEIYTGYSMPQMEWFKGKGQASIQYKYELDDYYNWIKRTEYHDSIPVRVVEREFVYQGTSGT